MEDLETNENVEINFAEERHLITQSDFNDLVKDTNISQRSAEILASRLQQWRLVAEDFRVTEGRKRRNESTFKDCFVKDIETGLTYAKDISIIFKKIDVPYKSAEWRLFIDGSVKSIKAVLLHIGNKHPSIPLLYGTNTKESYQTINTILNLIQYQKHQWLICSDLKIVTFLMGLKSGFSKQQCFLCLWEGRRRDLHYTDFKWESRSEFVTGVQSVQHHPLVEPSKIIIPPLHLKLGIIKNFVKALKHDGLPMEALKELFPKISNNKIENGKVMFKKIILNYFYIFYFI